MSNDKERQLARANVILGGLYRIAKRLNAAASQQEMIEYALEEATRLPGVQGGWVVLREGDDDFRIAATRDLPGCLDVPGAMEGDCRCRRQLLAGEFADVAKVIECERLQNAPGGTGGLRWHVSVPLRIGARTIGLMNLIGSEEELFGEDELHALNGMGNQIALALDRAAATGMVRQYAEQLSNRVQLAEAKYQTLMENANDAIVLLDPDGRVLEVNRRAGESLGLPRAEMIGRAYVELVGEASREVALASFKRLLDTGTQQVRGISLRHADGRSISTEISASLVAVGGAPVVLALIRDVTERERLEQQFRQAQKMEAVGRLAGGIAHDFNNLLTAILGYSGLLLDALPRNDAFREDVEEIRKAGRSAESLTRHLLAFSRKQILEPVVVDLNALVDNLDHIVRRLIGEDIEVVTRLGSGRGRVRADPSQLEQVLMNLVVNARDAMPEGGTLTIETADAELDEHYATTHAGSAPGQYVMLAVSDTGHGMDEQVQSHLFEPFFTTKPKGEGTGLGLATVYGIVKQSGGNIQVYSEPGRGTSFKIYLPQIDDSPEATSASAPVERTCAGAETVLVVEDHAGLRALARRLLEGYGYRVLVASDGEEALRICEAHPERINLLLTDVVMPGMSGRTLADRLTALYPATRVLYTSGYTDNAIAQHGVLAPGTPFLRKPYTRETLVRKVRQVLDTKW